ncbi:MAG: hypothetical protein ACREDJ_05965 [Methylocella sp.]
MRSARAREAAQYRARGSKQGAANAGREAAVTLGNARRDAGQARGAGDVESNRMFLGLSGEDPDFFACYSLDASL